MERTQIMLTPEIKRKVKYKAKIEGRSMADVIRDAIEKDVEVYSTRSQKEALLEMFDNAISVTKDLRPDLDSSNFRKDMAKTLRLK